MTDKACAVLMLNEAGVTLTVGVLGGVAPVPLRETVCGEPVALSVMLMAPLRLPTEVGINVTEILQFAPAARELPHVCVSAKSPDALIEAIVSAAFPEFVSVMACAALVEPVACEAKVRLVGASVTAGATPLPVNVIVSGESAALSVRVIAAVLAPTADGVKPTMIVQLAPAATLGVQVFVSVKSEALAPPIAILEKMSGTGPVFVTVTDWPVAALPTRLLPNPTLLELMETTGVPAVP